MNSVIDTKYLADELARVREEFEKDPDYVAVGLATDIAEQVAWLMEMRHLSRSELAEKIGVTRAYVTKVLNAPPNLTLRSIAALALALNATTKVRLIPSGEPNEGWNKAKVEAFRHYIERWGTTAGEELPEAQSVEATPKLDPRNLFGLYTSTT